MEDEQLALPVYVPCSSCVWLPAWTLKKRPGQRRSGETSRESEFVRVQISLPEGQRRERQTLDLTQLELEESNGKLPRRQAFKDLGCGVSNLGTLRVIHEASVLEALKNRWASAKYYVKAGPVLIAQRPPPSDDTEPDTPPECRAALTAQRQPGDGYEELPPHLCSVAVDAHRDLQLLGQDQYIMLTGEAGTGKAWSRKRLLEFLCEDSDLRPRASAVSFLLPALASTTDPPLNSNYQPWVVGEGCRRAGVCLELSYERLPGDVAALCGLRVELFLLHHRHVVNGPASVSTFPIFDHLLSAPSNVLDQLSLRPGTTFRYLQRRSGMSQPFSPSTYANSDGFWKLVSSVKALDAAEDDLWALLKAFAAVLHLGQVMLLSNHADSRVQSGSTVQTVAGLLGLSTDNLAQALLQLPKVDGVEHGDINASNFRTRGQPGVDACDGLAMTVYAVAANALVRLMAVRTALSTGATGRQRDNGDLATLGIVDMFSVKGTTLHAFMASFAEESMRSAGLFDVVRTFEYGLMNHHSDMTKLKYPDSVTLLAVGSLACLSDLTVTPSLSNAGFGRYLLTKRRHGIVTIAQSGVSFTIRHTTGSLTYEPTNFKEHNRGLDRGLLRLLATSAHPLLATTALTLLGPPARPWSFFTTDDAVTVGSRGTLSEHLETQLRNLSERVEDSKRHVVLCIRPNDEPRQKGAGFVNQTVARQMRGMAVVSLVKIGAHFSEQWSLRPLARRYRSLALLLLGRTRRERVFESFGSAAEGQLPSEGFLTACLGGAMHELNQAPAYGYHWGESGQAEGGEAGEFEHCDEEGDEDGDDEQQGSGNSDVLEGPGLMRRLCGWVMPRGSYEVGETRLFCKTRSQLERLEGLLLVARIPRARIIQKWWRRVSGGSGGKA